MKKLALFAAVLMVSLSGIKQAKAQVRLSINIGSQPVWGPAGYNHVDYYYFPDIDAYYYVPTGQYIYSNSGRWVWVRSLPAQYGNFNPYNAYKVVINKPKPYLQNNIYVKQYSKYKNYGGHQTIIRDSHDSKYYVVKGHPNYNGNVKHVGAVRPGSTERSKVNNRPNSPHANIARPISNNRGNEGNEGKNARPERTNDQRRINDRH